MAYPFRPQKEHNKGIKEPAKEIRHILRKGPSYDNNEHRPSYNQEISSS